MRLLPEVFSFGRQQYTLVDKQHPGTSFWLRPTKRGISFALGGLILFFGGVLIGASANLSFAQENSGVDSFLKLTTENFVFHYNRTFGERPSKETNQAWSDLFPKQGGYFRHPELAPERSALAVYHQLHCLDGIRMGYWSIFDAAMEGRKLVEDEIPFHASPPHIRHCIDLLRNSLMCNPDLAIEVKDLEKGGVSGFGTEHQCRNWNQLNAWVTNWETYGQKSAQPETVNSR